MYEALIGKLVRLTFMSKNGAYEIYEIVE
jgi:hypothetical protein